MNSYEVIDRLITELLDAKFALATAESNHDIDCRRHEHDLNQCNKKISEMESMRVSAPETIYIDREPIVQSSYIKDTHQIVEIRS